MMIVTYNLPEFAGPVCYSSWLQPPCHQDAGACSSGRVWLGTFALALAHSCCSHPTADQVSNPQWVVLCPAMAGKDHQTVSWFVTLLGY